MALNRSGCGGGEIDFVKEAELIFTKYKPGVWDHCIAGTVSQTKIN